MATKNIIHQFLGLNWDEDDLKYKMGLMENVKSTADFGQARPESYGRSQYAAQDRPVVDLANMPGPTLAQGQPQYANLMNIRSRLPRRRLLG